jgi:hypothetical protein
VVNFFQIDERILARRLKKQLKENLALLRQLLEAMPSISETISFAN